MLEGAKSMGAGGRETSSVHYFIPWRFWMLLINRKRRKKKAYDEHLFESIISKI